MFINKGKLAMNMGKFGGFKEELIDLRRKVAIGISVILGASAFLGFSALVLGTGEKKEESKQEGLENKVQQQRFVPPPPPERFDLVYTPCAFDQVDTKELILPENFKLTKKYLQERFPDAEKVDITSESPKDDSGFKTVNMTIHYNGVCVPTNSLKNTTYNEMEKYFQETFYPRVSKISDQLVEKAQSLQISEIDGSYRLVFALSATDGEFLDRVLRVHKSELAGSYLVEPQNTDQRGKRMFTTSSGRRKTWKPDGYTRCLGRDGTVVKVKNPADDSYVNCSRYVNRKD